MDELAIVDTSPLILLARVERLSLLELVGQRRIAPHAVIEEIRAKETEASEIARVLGPITVELVKPSDVPLSVAHWELGAGESSVIALALRHPRSIAVLDDKQARRCCSALGISTIGTLGVVVRAKLMHRIELARPVLEELVAQGMYVSPSLLREALARVGE